MVVIVNSKISSGGLCYNKQKQSPAKIPIVDDIESQGMELAFYILFVVCLSLSQSYSCILFSDNSVA